MARSIVLNVSLTAASRQFRQLELPEIALVTNHGYGGAKIPVGGAPDTGGQNFYVNTLARQLELLGYKVTILARGGFPFFDSDRIRSGTEFLSERIRYVFVPGGGDSFIRKEDIALALDEQLNWLEAFCQNEAAARQCAPWELYEFVNSHYWDAAVLATGLIARWRNLVVEDSLKRMLSGVVSEKVFEALRVGFRYRALGEAPEFYLGRLLIYHVGMPDRPVEQQVRAAASIWASARALDVAAENRLVDRAVEQLQRKDFQLDPRYEQLVAAAALGREILASQPESDEQLKRTLARIDRHVWTPHSLGELKDFNYRDRPLDIRRPLKFCERRSHERMICQRTYAFAATSAKVAECLWTHYHVPIEDTFYFPPCVDREVFREYSREEQQPTLQWLAEATGVDKQRLENGILILETSRMDRTKRKDLLLAAFARLADEFPDAWLVIGGGPENDVFASLRDQLAFTEKLQGRAFLPGAIPDEFIGPIFSVADIYATASEMEGFGMSASQAAAAGVPVVSTDTIPFCIHHAAEQALLFSPGDIDGLAAALRRLIANPTERERRGREISQTLTELDWRQRTEDFLGYLARRGFEMQGGVPAMAAS
jgi:glycosyltransferase involved in cell wall biosynthesis